MTVARPEATSGAKMVYLIKRRAETSREELIAHWFANHMRGVIDRNLGNRGTDQPTADHYVATLFDPRDGAVHQRDGAANFGTTRPCHALPRRAASSLTIRSSKLLSLTGRGRRGNTSLSMGLYRSNRLP